MSKRAEERALEIFPVKKVPYYGLACNAYSERDANLDNRTLFCMGYEQAEKDLALTWIDIRNILSIAREVEDENDDCPLLKSGLCDEILKRFNEQKKK